ncbi:MAG: gamma-glutamyl-gamma-aminobutyrate hydrolase family protein [Halobacteriovoraceae bacterium]|nr:gamma-glutamyl-gamma-aminobutyrate hydrolase family protein [Halobacteriovoraceae bacterium]
MTSQNIGIFDCAIKRPSLVCFNRLVNHFNLPFTYHSPPHQGLSSVLEDSNARAYIIFGSASNVEDHLPWQKELALFVDEKLRQGVPVLGLCFGHQLMADFYGCKIEKNKTNTSFKGTREVQMIKDSWGFHEGEKLRLFIAHSYQISSFSEEMEQVGTSVDCPWDAIIHKELPFVGFQSHPEGSLDFFEHEIKETTGDLPQTELQSATKDGLSVIERFLSQL